jgi:membrane-associated phospholipid phosphatase
LGATFFSTTFLHEFPGSKWRLPVIIGSYTAAAGVASMRILAGSHFLSDVLTGAVIGSLYGWLIPELHLKKRNGTISVLPAGTGIQVSLRF